ncbi:hypothetical protein AAE478_008711 [Parahypoxylon ruwenzoriense]
MNRRNSTKFHRLDRRKSTSSVKSVCLEHIHPETAERDAQAAAAQAFARAKKRSATDAALWPPPRNNDPSGISNGYIGTPKRRSNNSVIRRQQSVRFVRTGASKDTQHCSVTEDSTPTSNVSTGKLSVRVDAIELKQTINASATGMVSATKGAAGDYISALITGEEYYTPEDDIASAPSSYRKIRKSRSMFTTSEASMTSRTYIQASTPMTMNRLPSPPEEPAILGTNENLPRSKLKTPKSMSFLRRNRDQSSLIPHRHGSVPMALSRDVSAGTLNSKEGRMEPHSSGFLHSKPTNTDKFLRRSMRDTSNDTLPIYGKLPKDGGGSFRNRARKVSHSFKHKLKNFFNLVKGDTDEASFPRQQIEASRSHVTNLDNPDCVGGDEFQPESASDEAAFSRVTSGIPHLHAVPSHQQLRSRRGSVESLRSERRASDERSRVTSWTNSDTNTLNTLGSHRGEWDRQRLSVIKENGMHISSSSARPPGVNNHVMHSSTSVQSLPSPIPPQPVTVDSQRIYSALMKRLHEKKNNSRANDVQRQKSFDDFMKSGVIPPRGSSRDCESREPNSPATIRHVVSDGCSDSASVGTIERKTTASSFTVSAELGESAFCSNAGSKLRGRELSSTPALPGHEAKELGDGSVHPLSAPRSKKPTPPARTLSSRSSAFFASPTCHLFRTRSPYRRALQDSMKMASQDAQPKSPEFNPWMRSLTSLPIRCPSTCESEVDKKMQYAKSIYSTSTEEPMTGHSKNTSEVVERFLRPPSDHGDATIFLDPPVYRPAPPLPPKHRVTSSASSVEWKTWLSSNVSKLEDSPTSQRTDFLEYAVPSTRTSGHIREAAQINGEDEQLPLEVYKPTTPDSALATVEPNARVSSQASRQTLKKASPIMDCGKENEAPETPRFPFGATIRTAVSLSSMRSGGETAKDATGPATKRAPDSVGRKSLVNMPSLNALASNRSRGNPPSTRKLVRKKPAFRGFVTPTSSPGLSAAIDKQFGKMSDPTDPKHALSVTAPMRNENVSPNAGTKADADPYGVQGSGVLGPETDLSPQSVGSKKMVDIFLSSRRRRMTSDEDGPVLF